MSEAFETDDRTDDLNFYLQDLKCLAKHYIQRFFADRVSASGEPIGEDVLFQERFLDQVLNLDVCAGIDSIYKAVGEECSAEQERGFERRGMIPEDVRYVISLYLSCARVGIPKCYATGIILMYLELCKGCRTHEGVGVLVG